MRLKLQSIPIIRESCLNVRITSFTPIVDGLDEYIDHLKQLGLHVKDEEVTKMNNRKAKHESIN